MLVALTANPVLWAAENPLTASAEVSNEGYFVLNWDTSLSDSPLVLEQSTSPAFDSVITREVAAAGATTITGLADGEYYFRLRSEDRVLSDPVMITVEHHSLARAGTFFLIGACLFGLLITTIFTGNRRMGN